MTKLIQKSFQALLIGLVKFYQYTLSPVLGNHCRFYPSCSQYAIESIQAQGIKKGILLAAKRLVKCHPWHPGGVDPVPDSQSEVNR